MVKSAEIDAAPVLIMSQHDELIARVNPDTSWSVKWDKVVIQAYETLVVGSMSTPSNLAITAICRLLLAGRDNFLTSSWQTVEPWSHSMNVVKAQTSDPAFAPFALFGLRGVMGSIDIDCVWSVDWDEVDHTFSACSPDAGSAPIRGFCRLLQAAKDNFITKPFPNLSK